MDKAIWLSEMQGADKLLKDRDKNKLKVKLCRSHGEAVSIPPGRGYSYACSSTGAQLAACG